MYFLDYARHGLPFFFLAVEFHMNHIEVDRQHWVASLFYVSCYLLNLITYHNYHNTYVYSEMHTFMEYLSTSLGTIVLQLLCHYMMVKYNQSAYQWFLDKYYNPTGREEALAATDDESKAARPPVKAAVD